jgi:hypothetical protein
LDLFHEPRKGALTTAFREMGVPEDWCDLRVVGGKVLVSVKCDTWDSFFRSIGTPIHLGANVSSELLPKNCRKPWNPSRFSACSALSVLRLSRSRPPLVVKRWPYRKLGSDETCARNGHHSLNVFTQSQAPTHCRALYDSSESRPLASRTKLYSHLQFLTLPFRRSENRIRFDTFL